MADAALRRRAVFLGVPAERAVSPAWLSVAAAEAVLVRLNPALLDAWCQAMIEAGPMPSLQEVLSEPATGAESLHERALAAFAVWRWLRTDPAGQRAWERFVAELSAGTSPGSSLVRAYGERFGGMPAAEIELAWQVGASAAARAPILPLMDAGETRMLLEEANRLVVSRARDPRAEEVLSLVEQWSARRDAYLADARAVRLRWLQAAMPRLHPFYRNAGNSLGRALLAQESGDAAAWAEALWDWRRDSADGRELEAASRALLDGDE